MAKKTDYVAPATCEHIKPNGVPCGCIALAGERFCYFHAASRDRHARQLRYMRNTQMPFMLPMLESHEAIQVAIHEVMTALLYERIDLDKAKFLLRALQLASKNVAHCDFDCEDTAEIVDFTEQDELEEAAANARDESSLAGQIRNLSTEKYATQAKEAAQAAEQAAEKALAAIQSAGRPITPLPDKKPVQPETTTPDSRKELA